MLELPTAEQAAYIDRACSDDTVLRGEVIQLLRAHQRTGSILDAPPGSRLASLLLEGESTPERIGPWRVVRLTDPNLRHGTACVGR